MTGASIPLPEGPSRGFNLADARPAALRTYLTGRGIDVSDDAPVEVLAGGVSGTVIKVGARRGPVIVKQALGRLATPGEWYADPRRTITEARALELLHRVTPENTAELIDLDTGAPILTMSCASPAWQPWKDQLLADEHGAPDAGMAKAVAGRLGDLLARWHRASEPATLIDFADHATFRALRSDPFYRALGRSHPELADRLTGLADELDRSRGCLMHGDFSPKNVLTDPAGEAFWVVDHEVMVDGTGVFDVAFMLCHLSCKAVRPQRRHLLKAAVAFYTSYAAGGVSIDSRSLAAHTAALMLARVDGVSRVGYLDRAEQDVVRQVATAILTSRAPTPEQLWDRLVQQAGA